MRFKSSNPARCSRLCMTRRDRRYPARRPQSSNMSILLAQWLVRTKLLASRNVAVTLVARNYPLTTSSSRADSKPNTHGLVLEEAERKRAITIMPERTTRQRCKINPLHLLVSLLATGLSVPALLGQSAPFPTYAVGANKSMSTGAKWPAGPISSKGRILLRIPRSCADLFRNTVCGPYP